MLATVVYSKYDEVNTKNLPSENALHRTNGGHYTEADAQVLPVQATALVEANTLVTKICAQADDSGDVADDQGGAGIIRQTGKPFGEEVVSGVALPGSLLLS